MPLEKSGSKEARERNIKEMIASGHDPKQAVAASYSNQRKYQHHGHKDTHHNVKHMHHGRGK